MPEFKIEADALKREARFRRLSWGIVLVFTVVTVLLVVLRYTGLKFGLGFIWLLSLCFFGALFGSCILVFREAMSAAERQMTFNLDDDGITRNRQGYPPVHIAFSEIDYLAEEMKWLIVRSAEPGKKIAVSKNVNGYELIRAELSKYHLLSSPTKFRLGSAALAALSVLAWAAVFWFRDMRIAIPSGLVALTLLAIGSYRLWALLHRGPRKVFSWICVGVVWVAAILLICVRSITTW
jgi:hypothetical protein